jgi:predicted Zn-dependent protease
VLDNGTQLSSTDWIRDGMLANLFGPAAVNAEYGLRPAWPIGNLRLEVSGGAGSARDLASGIDDGVVLTCLWYIRVVDPQTMLLTGLTRDGVYVVKGGEVAGAATNFRFNDSPLSMLSRISSAGSPTRTLPREMADYANRAVAPPLVIEGMNFTSVSEAS